MVTMGSARKDLKATTQLKRPILPTQPSPKYLLSTRKSEGRDERAARVSAPFRRGIDSRSAFRKLVPPLDAAGTAQRAGAYHAKPVLPQKGEG